MHSKQDRRRLLWLQGVTCNGNSHSFLNHPALDILLDHFNLLYHPILPGLHDFETISEYRLQCDVLVFEGTFDPQMRRNGVLLERMLHHYAKSAKHIIALGTCASFGGLFKSCGENNSGLLYDGDELYGPLTNEGKKVINLSGCPAHPQWLGATLEMIANDIPIALDKFHRPVELYSSLVHHGCTRNEYFEWKVDAKDFGLKEGCLFYEQGCRGPMTHASCNAILWNETSSKTRVGTPCFGCTEPDFPKMEFFVTKKNMSIPQEVPLGVPKRAYLTIVGIAKTFHIPRLEGKMIDYEAAD